jgi:Met-zincin
MTRLQYACCRDYQCFTRLCLLLLSYLHYTVYRHNFHGSTQASLEQLQDTAYTKQHGLTSSVMDYLPINIISSKARTAAKVDSTTQPDYFTTTTGVYDKWAIEYGYKIIAGETINAFEQHTELAAIADKALGKQH